jgi:two-component system, cell cycle sensor histidine kinase and response regulator CckA
MFLRPGAETVSYPNRTRAAAQRAALFFLVAGLLAIVNSLLLETARPQQGTFIALGVLDLVIAALLRFLPWERWHVRALLMVVPVTFVIIGLFEVTGATTPYTYPIFFILVFIWIGLSLPPRTALVLAPLTVVAYIIPLISSGHNANAVESASVAVPVCVLIGEVVARTVSRLHAARDELELRVAERTAQLQAANEALQHELAERKQIETALRESELRFRQLAEHIHEAFWLSDPHISRLLYISPAYEKIWERSCASLYDQPHSFLEAVHPADRERVIAALGRQQHGEATDEEYRILRPDASVRWIWDRSFPVTDASGQVERIARVTQDITDRKQLEAQFLQAQKLEGIGRLAGGIAHDFNNLLTAIGGYADLIWDALSHDHPIRSDLEEIRKAVARATNLTRQLLAFARKQIIEPRVLNLNDLIIDMDKLLRRVIGEDIDLITRPAPNLGWVKADPGQIEQVLVNLALNARDAMPEGGKLTIETRNVFLNKAYARGHQSVTEGAYVLLAVSDTGVGMDSEIQTHAFEPFFTTKAQGKGTGLGLATCYGIIKQHGGNIWVYSEVGQGTTFKIYLPQVEGSTNTAPLQVEVHALPRGKETVLVVEDEVAVRALAARVLREQGYTVLEAGNGVEAIRVAEVHAPAAIDLLLTDVVMPHMGGKAVADQIITLYPTLKVLFISGYTDSAIVHHGRLDEGVAFLHKPFTPAVLARKVREVLDE